MSGIKENTNPSKTMPSYNNLYDGVSLPAKDEVAAAIAAVQSRRGGSLTPLSSPHTLNSPGCLSTPGVRRFDLKNPPTSTRSAGAATASASLFRQSHAKLQSFSFGESTETESSGPHSPFAPAGYALSPSMAQLRARQIIDESKSKRMAVGSPLSPAYDDSDDDTDLSSLNVDPAMMAQVGEFIDAIHKKKSLTGIKNASPANKDIGRQNNAPSDVRQKELNVVTENGNIQSPSNAEPTPRRANLKIDSLGVKSSHTPTPYLPDDDSSSHDDSDEHATRKNVEQFIDSLQFDDTQIAKGNIEPETEEEMDSFISSIEKPITSVGTNVEVKSVENNAHPDHQIFNKHALLPALETDISGPTIADELNAISLVDEKNNVATDGVEVKSNNGSMCQSINETERSAIAPTKFSFYTKESLLPMERSTHLTTGPVAPVEGKNVVEPKNTAHLTPRDKIKPDRSISYSPSSPVGQHSSPSSPQHKIAAYSTDSAVKKHDEDPLSPISLAAKQETSIPSSSALGRCSKSPTSKVATQSGGNNENPEYDASLARISKQIEEVVRSEVPSLTLGKVLAEANRRGITLDVVTEIYKKERFKFSSEKIAKWEAMAGVSPKNESNEVSSVDAKNVQSPRNDTHIQSSHHVTKDISSAALQELHPPIRKKVPLTPAMNSPLASEASELVSLASSKGEFNESQENTRELQELTAQSNDVTPTMQTSLEHTTVAEVANNICDESANSADSQNSLPKHDLTSATVREQKATQIKAIDTSPSPQCIADCSSASIHILSPQSMLDSFVVKIKEAVRSDNPSQELGIILAEAKKNHIPVNPLVELYTKERMALQSVPKDIVVSDDKSDDIALAPTKTEESDISDAISSGHLSDEKGLSEMQLLQLQQLVSNSGEFEEGLFAKHPEVDVDDDVEKAAEQHLQDINAFFSKFDIDGDETQEQAAKKSPEQQTPITEASEDRHDNSPACQFKTSKVQFEVNPIQEIADDPQDSSQYCERGNVAEVTTLKNGNETVLYMQESSLEVEFVEPVEPINSSPVKEKKKKIKKKKILKIRPRDNRRAVVLRDDLPGYLGYWKSPWEKNRIRSHYCSENIAKETINGVQAAATFADRRGYTKQRPCFFPESERVKDHSGYRDIDFYSLYEATTVQVEDQDIDLAAWDGRDVRQRFLHEKSVESRNWFGKLCDIVSLPINDLRFFPLTQFIISLVSISDLLKGHL